MTQPIPLAELHVATESRPPASGRQSMRFLCRLGQGGMAEVHLAECSEPSGAQRLVVVKRMHQQHQDDPATVRMFLDEARLALSLSHPNIVFTERVGLFEGRHGIVMEFLEGQPLHHVLKRAYETDGALDIELVAQIAIAALDGLHHAHELCDVAGKPLGVVHRDVSPQNLFVTYDGAVKLLDFGIAKNALQDGRTRTGMLKGKVAYMAPEQARGELLDRRADLWSLGVVLWEAVTGGRLFRGANEAATLNLTLTEAVAPPSSRREDVPAELEATLMRALQRRPGERYASAAQMRDELEAWLSTREPSPNASLSQLMQRLFAREIRDQRQQLRGLLSARLDASPDSGVTLRASQPPPSDTFMSLRGTQVSSVTYLMEELTRQKQTTTRLLSGLLVLSAIAVLLGVCFLVSQRQQPASLSALSKPPTAAPPTSPATLPSAVGRVAEVAPVEEAPTTTPARRSPATSARLKPTRPLASSRTPVEAPSAPTSVASATIETGTLNLDSTPWSLVTLGGRALGTTPLVGVTLPSGVHTLVLDNPELGIKTAYQVTIVAGKTTARRVGLE